MGNWKHFLGTLPYLLISPFLLLFDWIVLCVADLVSVLFPRIGESAASRPNTASASVVIPNWNGRDLLAKYLPPLIEAMSGHPDNEIIVVENGSTDGSAEFVRRHFPQVKLLALPGNLGFGGGSNAGFRAANNDIVVLLNSDMRVERGFLQPLLDAFTDEKVFAVSCQIFFSDPTRVREETGLTQAWWAGGGLRVRHRIDDNVRQPFPCFYGGGGSCAFDRRKFLELGGFDALLAPFYLEDTDLGYLAWKRGWKVLYQPLSIVYHEHRGTIGKHFSSDYIQTILKKNFLLFTWKNIHEPGRLLGHFAASLAGAAISTVAGDSPERTNPRGILRATLALPRAVASRIRARRLARVSDTEAFRRPLGGYFRDRFDDFTTHPERLSVLFLSPYPICPPTHGGGVFMYQTLDHLVRMADVHMVALLDFEHQRPPHDELAARCASAEFLVRISGAPPGVASITPHAVREFANGDLEWLLHRKIYQDRVDVLQLEYLPMAQYARPFQHVACILFEHDLYFQSIARQLYSMNVFQRGIAFFEYLRALRYELRTLPRMDRIQVCSTANRDVLLSFRPQLAGRVDDDLRAGIDVARYEFRPDGREPDTMLFLGSFRHTPNLEALRWFSLYVLPQVLRKRPKARLVVVGSDPPPRHFFSGNLESIDLVGFVDDIREPLARYSVFVCPILAGSGMRVKLLEAYAAGIPTVSTTLGAEGLATPENGASALADSSEDFAARVVELLEDPARAAALAHRAHAVVKTRDMAAMTARLVETYRDTLHGKNRRA